MATTLHDVLDRGAGQSPGAAAVTCDGRTVTYAQLQSASVAIARRLTEFGVQRRDRVVVLLPPTTATVALIFACSRVGAVFVVLHEDTRPRGLAHVLDDAAPVLVIADDPEARACATARAITAYPLSELSGRTTDGHPAPSPGPLATDPVCLIYTSGSTGAPKAVVTTHQQLCFATEAIADRLRYRADDVIFVPLPLSFDYGLYQLVLGALAGAHVHLAGRQEAGVGLVRALRESAATVFAAVPPVAGNLARLLVRHPVPLPLRLLTSTGSTMPPTTLAQLRAALPDLRVQLMFGLTECKRVAIMPPDEDLRRPHASGLPLPGTEVEIVDDQGRRLPSGAVGEIVVRGPHVMAGYWHRPDDTARRFPRADGLFPELRTGDYGSLDDDGYLSFAGRRDDQYKSRGFRVNAAEVEACAAALPGVLAAAVLPPGPDRPEAVLFAVTELDPTSVLTRLRREIEPYKVPTDCRVVGSLPLTSSQKVDRAALAGLLPQGVTP